VKGSASPTGGLRLLTRLGDATLQHPVLVGGTAIIVAFVVGASIAVVAGLA
jgi:hypothetical protein